MRYIVFFFILTSSICYSQSEKEIFIRYNLYNTEERVSFSQKDYQNYFLLTPGYFLYKNSIDLKVLSKTIEAWFPDKRDNSYLVIDWERDYFKNLKKGRNTKDFKKSEKAFMYLIKLIKDLRPNLKIGIYGIPFRFNYSFQEIDDLEKFTTLLLECDFIAPSLYLSFLNVNSNKKFLENNLEQTFKLASKLKKPVIPFFWYMHVNQNNTVIVDKDNMDLYLNYIYSYKYLEKESVFGLFWWDAASISHIIHSKSAQEKNILERIDILKYYNF
ncbi:hypothetical protein [Myroides phaeus]|uniref:hypothetical protein n=1 Tax=Myroides phaeus TaxID=702745 RepID=UPI0013036F41|nr:hypothetical protein [Myroides phaeus]